MVKLMLIFVGLLLVASAIARKFYDEVEVIADPIVFLKDEAEPRNGRDQIPHGPNTNCTVLEKDWGSWRDIRLPHVNSANLTFLMVFRNMFHFQAYDCTRFYECDDTVLIEKACADRYRTRYDPVQKRCEWNNLVACQNFNEYVESLKTQEQDQCS